MRKRILSVALLIGMIIYGIAVYAADGDLLVNGKVGIGTTTPQTKLHVSGDITMGDATSGNMRGIHLGTAPGADGSILALSSSGVLAVNDPSRGAYLTLLGSDINWLGGCAILGAGNSTIGAGAIGLATNGIMRIFVHSNGNIGIGTTEPDELYKLYVAGNAYTTGTWGSSDIRFKENIASIETPLDKILKMKGVSFTWKTAAYKSKGFPAGRHYGVLAQEIEKIIPEVVNTSEDGEKAVAYTEIIPVLIEAVKEQQKMIDQQNKKIEVLSSKLEKMQ